MNYIALGDSNNKIILESYLTRQHMLKVKQQSNRKQRKSSNKIEVVVEISPEQKAKLVIQTAKQELDLMIQQLDNKIKKRMEINQCKFLCAYKNHLDKVTRQLKVLKQSHDTYQNKFSSDKAIIHLGKVCTFFRQQAMRLHNQLQDALNQASIFKRKSEILEQQIKNGDESHKRLIKIYKDSQNINKQLTLSLQQKQRIITDLSNKNTNYNLSKSFLNTETKLPQHPQCKSAQKTKKQNMGIKIPKNFNCTSNIEMRFDDWLNNSNGIQNSILSPKTPKLSLNKMNTKFNSFKSCNQTMTKTKTRAKSTVNENRTNFSLSEFRDKQNCIQFAEGPFGKDRYNYQSKICDTVIEKIKRVRESLKNEHNPYQIESKTIKQFICNDKDIFNLLTSIFPSLPIKQNLTIQQKIFINNKKNESEKEKSKILTYLSTQLMRKMKLQIKTERRQKNAHHLTAEDENQLQIVDKKSRVKTQANEPNATIEQSNLLCPREKSCKKINQVFKRKTLTNKTLLQCFYNSSRQRSKNIKN